MKQFSYTITDPIGIHARPAGILAKAVKEFSSTVTLEKDGKSVSAAKLIAVMGMGIKCGDTLRITVEGEDEAEAAAAVEKFFQENL